MDLKMEPQKPAQGIMKTGDWGDAVSYQIICDCHSPDHNHTLWVEAEITGINVTIYTNVKSKFWSMNRFKQIWILLTKGYLEQETVLTMNEQTALNYSETLKKAIDDVQQFREKRVEKP